MGGVDAFAYLYSAMARSELAAEIGGSHLERETSTERDSDATPSRARAR